VRCCVGGDLLKSDPKSASAFILFATATAHQLACKALRLRAAHQPPCPDARCRRSPTNRGLPRRLHAPPCARAIARETGGHDQEVCRESLSKPHRRAWVPGVDASTTYSEQTSAGGG